MAIYIKGMEMPTGCALLLKIFPDGRVGVPVHLNWAGTMVVNDAKAVSVPAHGRLIDADALADVSRGFIAMYDSCPFSQLSLPDKARRDELQSALAEVINAPTIIPAEEGET